MKSKGIAKRLFAIIICLSVLLSITVPAYAETADNNEDTLIVGVPTDRCPIFYIDNETNEITGIGADLMFTAAQEAGYKVVFQQISEPSLKEALDSDKYDVLMPFGSAIDSASGKATIVSENLIQTPFTLVTEGKRELPPFGSLKVGMLQSQKGIAESINNIYPGMVIVTFETTDDCVKALRANEVDALLHNSFVWSYVLQKPAYSDLIVQPSTMFTMDFRVGTTNTPEGAAIISRLNTGIAQISDTRRQAVTLDYTSRRLYKYDFYDFIYSYWLIILFAFLLFLAIIIIAVEKTKVMKKRHNEDIQNLMTHDPLTGILSMDGFRKRVEELLRENPKIPYFLSYNNIRDFKFINDRFGRSEGDELLKFWAQISKESLKENEAIGRITADRFAVLRNIMSDEDMRSDEINVINPVRNYFIDRGMENPVNLCSGIYVLTPNDHKNIDVDHMLDMALIAEKRVRKNHDNSFAFYNPEQWEKGKRMADIIYSLPSAIESGDIQVYYQPQINYETKEIIGAEALSRWNHKKLGVISPSEFIPILEDTGLVFDLDKYVWETVCRDLSALNEKGIHIAFSINVSRLDIREDRDIPELFSNLIKKYKLSPDQLHIEITESAYVEDTEELINTTNKLREYGFKVEMDDFGSGYSSLNMLKEVNVDRIKLDLNFLTSSGNEKKSETILSCVIQMIRELEIELITEGVETAEQADFLQSKGANAMQGYYFYKPMPIADFEKLKEGTPDND